ncbi:MAG: NADH-quinone oxidoreductase subunit C [Negativicutes bacterium]|jgi:Ni,Fe-hydrogenase III large subunit/Ni,Fe-hydrogenase III component G
MARTKNVAIWIEAITQATLHGKLQCVFANDEREINGCFAIYALVADKAAGEINQFGLLVEDDKFPSLTPLLPSASWYEREIHDLFGLRPLGHPQLQPLIIHAGMTGDFPMRKDAKNSNCKEYCPDEPNRLEEFFFEVPVGPIHAGIIEPGHFRFTQNGENIVKLDAKLFFTHRGIEKTMEGKHYAAAYFSATRICGACTVSHALSYSQAVEKAAGCVISARAASLRIFIAEMERLYNHIGDVGNLGAGCGFAVAVSVGSRLKEELLRQNEQLTGSRWLRDYVRPGGVAFDIPDDDLKEAVFAIEDVFEEFCELTEILDERPAFLNRIETTGVLDKDIAEKMCAVGVAARASGIAEDSRFDFSYGGYDQLVFDVACEQAGDVAARMNIRINEVWNSVNILRQIIEQIPASGEPVVSVENIKPYTQAIGWSESARGMNIHWLMFGENNTIYRCFVRSASYANWPVIPYCVANDIIADFPLINKSFELCYACIDR